MDVLLNFKYKKKRYKKGKKYDGDEAGMKMLIKKGLIGDYAKAQAEAKAPPGPKRAGRPPKEK